MHSACGAGCRACRVGSRADDFPLGLGERLEEMSRRISDLLKSPRHFERPRENDLTQGWDRRSFFVVCQAVRAWRGADRPRKTMVCPARSPPKLAQRKFHDISSESRHGRLDSLRHKHKKGGRSFLPPPKVFQVSVSRNLLDNVNDHREGLGR